MATEKVGIYRSYYGSIPVDKQGRPLPKNEWPQKRSHSWVVRWFNTDGQRYSRSFPTRKEAELFSESKQNHVRQGKTDPPPTILLSEFAKEHEKIMQGQVARETLYDQMRALRMFIQHVGSDRKLLDITPRHAESFVANRLSTVKKIATVNKDIRTLKRIFNLAIDPRGYLPASNNPFAKIKQRRISSKPVRFVNPGEFQLLLKSTEDLWWNAFLSLAYTTAARQGELVHLTWADLDFENNRIRIVCKEKQGNLSFWEPKDHEGRILPVPPEVMQLLANLQAVSAEGCPYVFVPTWRWEFIQQAGKNKSWDADRDLINNLNRRFHTLRKRAKVAQCTMHDLRRSCITNWAKFLPIHVVQRLAGHSDIKTTERYYLSVQEDDLEKARQVQSKILEKNPTDQKLTNSGQNGPFEVKTNEGSST